MKLKTTRAVSEVGRTADDKGLLRFVLPAVLAAPSSLLALAVLLAFSPLARAQMHRQGPELPPAAARITTPVDDSRVVPLPGNTLPSALGRFDQGQAASGLPTGRLRILFSRGQDGDKRLRAFLDSTQDPHSPGYHRWLTPQQYGSAFGIADQDLEQVKAWLTRAGFRIEGVGPGKNFIEFSGTVGILEKAFHTELHTFAHGGVPRIANATDPRIPAALAPVIEGISPMHDVHAVPQGTMARLLNSRHSMTAGAAPAFVNAADQTLYVTPADAATLYDSPNSFNKHFAGAVERTGAGVKLGIAGYSDLPVNDYLNYRSLFLHEATPLQPTLVVDGVDPGVEDQHDGQITLIDAEIAAALAPRAEIYVYSSKSDLLDDGLTDAITRAVDDNVVSILSVSYARCEYELGASGNAIINELWQQAAAQGISVVVAAGDTGAAGCDDGDVAAAGSGLAVNGLASTPFDLAVGGTDFDVLAQGFGSYVDSSVGSSAPASASINGYIPEDPWNNAITNNPPASVDSDVAGMYDFGNGPTTLIVAGGGGISSLAVCTGGYDGTTRNCSGFAGYPTPSFQGGLNPNSPGDAPAAARYLPDLALFAGDGRQYPAVWAVCSDNQVAQAQYTFTDCRPGMDGSYSVEGAGGTGAAASAAAGILAMLSESLGGDRLGLVNNTLYNLYTGTAADAVFHDVSAGNNSVPCTAGSPNCGSNAFLTGYNAGPGYDLTTGLGSVDVSALIAAWPSASFEATSTVLTLDSGSAAVVVTHGDSVNLAAAVTSAATPGTTATGNVSVTGIVDPSAPDQFHGGVNENISLSGGQGSRTSQKLPGGTYDLQAYYPGDATHAPSTSNAVKITVNPEASALQLILQVEDVNDSHALGNTFSYGSFGFVYVQPTSASGDFHGPATGPVTLLNEGMPFSSPESPSSQTLNSAGRAAFPLAHVAPGSYQLSATYKGDSSYSPSATVGTTAVTITKGPTTLTISPLPADLDASATKTVTVTLMTDSTGDYPSGGITLTANGTSVPANIQRVFTKINSVEEIGTFQVRGSALAAGANTLTVTYPGDVNYAGSTAGTAINVTGSTGGTFTMTGPPAGIAVSASQAQSSETMAVASTGNFAGVVKLSCALNPATETAFYQCTVTPSVTLQAGMSTTAAVTIHTVTSAANTGNTNKGVGAEPMQLRFEGAGLILCSGVLLLIPARRRCSMLLLTAAALLGTAGCGLNVTPVKSFTAVITGTSGGTTVSMRIPVRVQ